ncbi:MAG: hypothetical protein ACOYXR_09205 [Nitrospirota bacterium]
MTLDDSPGVEFRRRRDHEHKLDREEQAQRDWENSPEAVEAHWEAAFAAHAKTQLVGEWDDKPGLDRRLHSVDGERQPLELPAEWLDL